MRARLASTKLVSMVKIAWARALVGEAADSSIAARSRTGSNTV